MPILKPKFHLARRVTSRHSALLLLLLLLFDPRAQSRIGTKY